MAGSGEFSAGSPCENEIGLRQAFLADNFVQGIGPYLGGQEHEGVMLRPHQSPALSELQGLMAQLRDSPDRRILWPSPPNFGKSTMAALAMRAAGIGRRPPHGGRPLRALVLVPRDIARRQVLKACHQFAPGLRVSGFVPSDGREAIDHADALVMTYKGCIDTPAEDWQYIARRSDMRTLDEVHRALGMNTAGRLRRDMDENKPTVLALSATPDFSEDRKAADILRITHTLKGMTPREAVEAGVSNDVQLIALYSGLPLHFKSKRTVITESDAQPLIENKRRNQLITAVMRDMGNLGLRGLVHCIPGQGGSGRGNFHAELIAEMASDRDIIDPHTGIERKLSVVALGVQNPRTPDLLEDFRLGGYDTVTFSRLLIEAYDDDVRYILSTSPTASSVDMGQLVGRGGRLGDPRVTKLFCIIDLYSSSARKDLQTPFHVFGEHDFYQGMTISNTNSSGRVVAPKEYERAGGFTGRPIKKGDELYEGMSDEVRKALARIPPGTVLDDRLITKQVLTEVPPGYVPLQSVPAVVTGKVTDEGARYALKGRLDGEGRSALVTVQTDALRAYVSQAAFNMLEKRYNFGAVVTRREVQNFLAEQGWPDISFDGFVAECVRAGVDFEVRKKNLCLEPQAAATLLHSIAEIPLINSDQEVLLGDLVGPLQCHGTKELLDILRRSPEVYENHMRIRRRTRQPGAYQPVNALTVEGAVLLVKHLMKSSARRKRVSGSPQEIVAKVQQEFAQYAWNRKLQIALGATVIDDFMNKVSYEQTPPPPDQVLNDMPPSSLLDGSHRLSAHGENWWQYAKCRDEDPRIFTSMSSTAQQEALKFCNGCPVKGDCLLAHMRVAEHRGTVGGLRHSARARLLPIRSSVISWLEETRPQSAPKGRRKPN